MAALSPMPGVPGKIKRRPKMPPRPSRPSRIASIRTPQRNSLCPSKLLHRSRKLIFQSKRYAPGCSCTATAANCSFPCAAAFNQATADKRSAFKPMVGTWRPRSPGSRSDSQCSERSSQLSTRAPQREHQQPPLYSVVVAVPYVKNAMLISNFNDACCWLPISSSGAPVDDWVVIEENYISSVTLNGKASGAGVGGPVEWGNQISPRKAIYPLP